VTAQAPSVEPVDDPALAADLADLVNRVYGVAEAGLWQDGKSRTSEAQLRELIEAGEIAAATGADGLVGCVRVRELEPGVGEFGMLAVDPPRQGAGIGGALLDFAERHARERGATAMRLQLLVPRDGTHPSKIELDRWYGRRGYRPIDRRAVEALPLAVPCDFVVYERPL
jgi:GNAT superfamily N-acetyltransferase